jgi:hypothetical protein
MARLKDGYWLTKDGEVISIYDHFMFLSELEAKVRTELGVKEAEKKWASSLGMFAGEGWGLVKKEPPAARKLRFMTSAFKAGWVRIRRHSDMPYMVLEFWKATDDTLTNIAVGLKELGVPATETVETHEVSRDLPSRITAAKIYGRLTGETEEPGFSAYNPKKTGVVPMKGGSYCYRVTGNPMHFKGRKRVKKLAQNPQATEDWGQVTYARLFVGLKTSRPFNRQTASPVNSELDIDWVRQKVEIGNLHVRNDFKAGYSLVPQEGRFVPEKFRDKDVKASDLTLKQIKSFREKSVQVILFPEGDEVGENIDKWFHRINMIGNYLLLDLDQYMVIYEVVLNGKFIGTGAWTFNEPPVGLEGIIDFRKLAEEASALPKKGG